MTQERILVVDDEAPVRGIVCGVARTQRILNHRRREPDEAHEPARAEPQLLDLVLSDIMMPGTDGLSSARQHLCRPSRTPGRHVTAVHDVHVTTNAFRRGAIDYLLKPFERTQLESVVEARHRARRHLQNTCIPPASRRDHLRRAPAGCATTMQDLERSYDITLEAMGDALDLRDEETEGHSRRVTAYTIALARAPWASNSDELRVIARGAFLHDIGKIATPDASCSSPARSMRTRWPIMREHCQRGYEMVRKIPFLREAAEIVYAHQERFDGTGYPRGLRARRFRSAPASLPSPTRSTP